MGEAHNWLKLEVDLAFTTKMALIALLSLIPGGSGELVPLPRL